MCLNTDTGDTRRLRGARFNLPCDTGSSRRNERKSRAWVARATDAFPRSYGRETSSLCNVKKVDSASWSKRKVTRIWHNRDNKLIQNKRCIMSMTVSCSECCWLGVLLLLLEQLVRHSYAGNSTLPQQGCNLTGAGFSFLDPWFEL